MKALMKVARGKGNIELREVPVPVPSYGEVVIRVQVAGVCGTDVHIYSDRFRNNPPMILGHEFSGTVESTGPEVALFKKGDRVVSENNPFACGICRICKLGFPNMCPQKRAMGILSDGCFANFVRLPAHLLHIIPDHVTFEEAALMEPLAVAVHAVIERCGITPGDIVVVLGPGAIGLLAAQVARAEGAEKVLVTGTSRDKTRFQCAETLGLECLDIEILDIHQRIMDLTGGIGADVVVETSGSPKAIPQGLNLLRKNGRMAVIGITGCKEISVNWDDMVAKGFSLLFAYSSRGPDWEKAIGYLRDKKVETFPLITHRYRIEQWQEAFHRLENFEAIRPVFILGEQGIT